MVYYKAPSPSEREWLLKVYNKIRKCSMCYLIGSHTEGMGVEAAAITVRAVLRSQR